MAYEARPNPAHDGATPLILVCHENRGLTPHIRDVTRRLAKEGYVAVAVDLVSRDGGTAAHNEADIPDLLTRPDPAQHVADFQAAVDSYGSDAGVDTDRLGMVGYCFGGGITWRAATIMETLKAAAPYYGPPPPLEDVPNIKAAVLGVYSDDPEDFANKGREELEQALTDAGIVYEIKIYPGTMHAFHNDTGQRYNAEQAQQAWTDTLAWFAEHV
jgi:carboxymethylenebutenolidase